MNFIYTTVRKSIGSILKWETLMVLHMDNLSLYNDLIDNYP